MSEVTGQDARDEIHARLDEWIDTELEEARLRVAMLRPSEDLATEEAKQKRWHIAKTRARNFGIEFHCEHEKYVGDFARSIQSESSDDA